MSLSIHLKVLRCGVAVPTSTESTTGSVDHRARVVDRTLSAATARRSHTARAVTAARNKIRGQLAPLSLLRERCAQRRLCGSGVTPNAIVAGEDKTLCRPRWRIRSVFYCQNPGSLGNTTVRQVNQPLLGESSACQWSPMCGAFPSHQRQRAGVTGEHQPTTKTYRPGDQAVLPVPDMRIACTRDRQDKRSSAMPTIVVQASIVSLALLCTSVILSGCSQPATSSPFYTSRGLLVQGVPASGRPPVAQGAVGRYDGLYQGPANAVFTGGGRCMTTQRVTDFKVRDNVAAWGGYSGTIDPNGYVEMTRGFEYLTGQFQGNRFIGRLETGAWSRRGPSCVFSFTLQRVGP